MERNRQVNKVILFWEKYLKQQAKFTFGSIYYYPKTIGRFAHYISEQMHNFQMNLAQHKPKPLKALNWEALSVSAVYFASFVPVLRPSRRGSSHFMVQCAPPRKC